MTDKILSAIRSIENRKREAKKHPGCVLLMELYTEIQMPQNELKQGVNELIKSGLIEWGQTINDIYFKTKNQ